MESFKLISADLNVNNLSKMPHTVYTTAIHEAGHVIIGQLIGANIHGMDVFPDGYDEDGEQQWAGLAYMDPSDKYYHDMRVCLAGAAAECYLCNIPFTIELITSEWGQLDSGWGNDLDDCEGGWESLSQSDLDTVTEMVEAAWFAIKRLADNYIEEFPKGADCTIEEMLEQLGYE
jgi:hypothetical protein